jgi:hypothetical protein
MIQKESNNKKTDWKEMKNNSRDSKRIKMSYIIKMNLNHLILELIIIKIDPEKFKI